jgi:hypothetical protein
MWASTLIHHRMNKPFCNRLSDLCELFKALQFISKAGFVAEVLGTLLQRFNSKILQNRGAKDIQDGGCARADFTRVS